MGNRETTFIKTLKRGFTIFGDMDDKEAFLVAQGDTLMIDLKRRDIRKVIRHRTY